MRTRKPAVAGRFYPDNPNKLKNLIASVYEKEKEGIRTSLASKTIIGGIVPHAGYMFSAYQAVHYFEIIKLLRQQVETFIIINPNHTGVGSAIALDTNDAWETPFGNINIDKEFSDELSFEKDKSAHQYEHSGEVMLPLLQHFINYDFKIVPITLTNQNPKHAELLADKLFEVKNKLNRNINIIASCDFSHFVSPEFGKKQDDYAIENILKLNPEDLYNSIKKHNISACGYGPIMSLIYYAKKALGNPVAEILKRGHSGEIIPSNEVVDYISFLFYNKD